jgi:chloramphenicol O-acetyltransferase
LAITSRVALGGLQAARKKPNRTPFSLFLYGLMTAANQVPQLRQRIRVEDGRDVVVEHPVISPAFVVQAREELFNFATVPFPQSLDAFGSAIRVQAEALAHSEGLAAFDGLRDDILYCTCLPWIDFTHISHPVDVKIADSVPRVAWGRFGADQTVAVNVQAHHALVDGRHMARFFEALADALSDLSA